MTTFRFIHCADIHLDSPLRGLAGEPAAAAARIRSAPREALETLIDRALEMAVDFIVIAGDLYDGDWRDYQTGLFFAQQMGRLAQADIPAFVLHGNHDAQSQITRSLTLPDNVAVFSARQPQTFRVDHLGVVLHGQSFARRDVSANLAADYPTPEAAAFNIGVLHTALEGMPGHAPYAPCSLDELVAKGYQYWALGHVHSASVLHENPHVVFPGNLQGRHIRESGPKGAYVVDVQDGEVRALHPLMTDVVRWGRVRVDAGQCASVADVAARIALALASAVDEHADGRLLAARVQITGRSPAHAALQAAGEHLLAEARAAAGGLGEEAVWVERVVVQTQPYGEPAWRAPREDAVGELMALCDSALDDADLLEKLKEHVGELLNKLPHDVRAGVEDAALSAAAEGDYAALVRRASAYLEARLSAQGEN